MGSSASELRRSDRDQRSECRAYVEVALDLDVAAVCLKDVLHDAQAKPSASVRLLTALVRTIEALEYARMVLLGDADAGILNS